MSTPEARQARLAAAERVIARCDDDLEVWRASGWSMDIRHIETMRQAAQKVADRLRAKGADE